MKAMKRSLTTKDLVEDAGGNGVRQPMKLPSEHTFGDFKNDPSDERKWEEAEALKTGKPIEPGADNMSSDDEGAARGQRNRNLKKNLVERVNNKEYQEDNDLALSDLEENQRKELLDLEMQIESENLTRGERRRLQNKRNVLKAKIKKELETEGHKQKISKLQKKLLSYKKEVSLASTYKRQRDALREENTLLQKKISE